jgi:predicted AAA+ superfamily ATPase
MPLPAVLHAKFLQQLRYYTFVGGMPAAVKRFRQQRQLQDAAEVHDNLLATFRDDFYKYASSVQHQRLLTVLQAIPRQLGQKFMYSHIDRHERSLAFKQALHLLTQARLAHTVLSTDAHGLPFKMILLDVGLGMAALGLAWTHVDTPEALTLANAGPVAEQLIGQGLRLQFPPSQDPQLYYWCRQQRGAAAEVDYVIQHGKHIVPIEVKAGATGTLKSLHQLMAERPLALALRFNTDVPSRVRVNVGLRQTQRATYELLSLPLYMVSETQRLLTRSFAA